MIAPLVPVYVWVTPFRIVRHTDPETHVEAFRAEWTRGAMKGRPATDWRHSREAVRASMANLYADISEVK